MFLGMLLGSHFPPPNLHGWLHGECRFLFFLLVLAFQEITSLKQLDFEFTKSGSMIPPVLGNMVCFKIQICRPKNMSLKNQNKKKNGKKNGCKCFMQYKTRQKHIRSKRRRRSSFPVLATWTNIHDVSAMKWY